MRKARTKWALAAAAAWVGLSGATVVGVGEAGAASKPVLKIALCVPLTGAGSIPKFYTDPVDLAVAALKKKGDKVTLKVYDTGLTATKAITAVEDALQTKPTVIIGVPVVPQILAIGKLLTRAKVPLLNLSAGNQADYFGKSPSLKKTYGTGSSVWSFRVGVDNSLEATAGAEYMVTKLHEKNVGLMYQTATPPISEINAVKAVLAANGGKLVATEGYTYGATDLTQQVLAMKTADGVMTWGYPNNVALALTELRQNGITAPVVTDQSGTPAVADHIITTTKLLTTLYSAVPCNTTTSSNSKLEAFDTAFSTAYGHAPTFNAADAYDAVMIAEKLVTQGGGPSAMLKHLETETFPGLCQTYHSNAQHSMGQSAVVVGFKGTKVQTVYTYTTKKK